MKMISREKSKRPAFAIWLAEPLSDETQPEN